MYERLLNIMNAMDTSRVLLAGDFMLDTYLFGNIDRISPEAPVMVLNVTERQQRCGGAGSVATDLVALGAQVACLGVVGPDRNGEHLKGMLQESGQVNVEGILVSDDRPTTSKERIIGLAQHRHRQQLMRIDEECSHEIPPAVREALLARAQEWMPWCDVVCVEDYNKGVFSETFCQELIALARRHNKKVLVDPAAITAYTRYCGAWLVKPNRRELARAAGIELNGHDTLAQAAAQVARQYDIENVIVTLDKEGAFLYQRGKGKAGEDLHEMIPTRARTVYDVTGAGDMVLAMMGMLVGGHYEHIERPSLSEVTALANIAGGLEVERFGSVGVTREEIVMELVRENRSKTGKFRSLDSLQKELQWARQQGMKVVFTNGCFDLLHSGHIGLLTRAKEEGDLLVVAINSDRSVSAIKGPERPIHKEQERAAILSALEAVDYVVIFDAPTPIELIEAITPDVLVKGADWTGAVVGQDWVEAHGGRVALVPLSKGRSTTNIIEKVIEKTSNRFKNKTAD